MNRGGRFLSWTYWTILPYVNHKIGKILQAFPGEYIDSSPFYVLQYSNTVYNTVNSVVNDTMSAYAPIADLQNRIKELRLNNGWSQEDLAREIGVSLSTIQRWESRVVKPSRLARKAIEDLLQRAGSQEYQPSTEF